METKTYTVNKQSIAVFKKLSSILLFVLLFYVLPLVANPMLLFNWKVIFLAFISSLLYATQPRVSIAESKHKNVTDKNTMWLIIIVSGTGQVMSLLEWAYFQREASGNYINSLSAWAITGAFLLITGTMFRLYAIYTLGKYFTATVQIMDEHKIVKTGPYKLLRHPSYTGAFVAMLGCAIFLQSVSGIIIFGIGMLFVYHLRIKTEEKTLLQNFGTAYSNYCNSTWKMFPWIW